MADPRQCGESILAAGPLLANPKQGTAVFIVGPITIPGKTHFHPAILVAMDFFAFRAGNHRHLGPIHQGFVFTQRPPAPVCRNGVKVVAIARRFAATLFFQGLWL